MQIHRNCIFVFQFPIASSRSHMMCDKCCTGYARANTRPQFTDQKPAPPHRHSPTRNSIATSQRFNHFLHQSVNSLADDAISTHTRHATHTHTLTLVDLHNVIIRSCCRDTHTRWLAGRWSAGLETSLFEFHKRVHILTDTQNTHTHTHTHVKYTHVDRCSLQSVCV